MTRFGRGSRPYIHFQQLWADREVDVIVVRPYVIVHPIYHLLRIEPVITTVKTHIYLYFMLCPSVITKPLTVHVIMFSFVYVRVHDGA